MPVSPAHCQSSHSPLLSHFTCQGSRCSARQRLREYLGQNVPWPGSHLWEDRSWKHRSPGTIHFWIVYLAIQREQSTAERRGRVSVWGHYTSYINERLHWQSILGTMLLLYTKRAFGLFKILPPIGRKIIHSWVTKWHLCSAASWSHLIPLDLI